MVEECPELLSFVRGEMDSASFAHREHVRMGFEMLKRHDFAETAFLFTAALRKMAAMAGKPDSFHQTITIAFLSAIAERMTAPQAFSDFAAGNPDLMDKSVLLRWYRPERLASDAARRSFLLPEPRL